MDGRALRVIRGDEAVARPALRLHVGPVVLRTPRLVLRPLSEGDAEAFVRTVRQSRDHLEAFSKLHQPGETDVQLFARQLQLTEQGERTGQAMRRMMFTHGGELVGACNLNAISRGLSCVADANWWVAAGCLRRGYALEGLSALMAHALADPPEGLGLDEVCAHIQRENAASIGLALRLGFVIRPGARTYLQTGERWSLHDLWTRRRGEASRVTLPGS